MLDFIDRTHEVGATNQFVNQSQASPRIEIWSAQPHSGITHFLRHCSSHRASSISLYGDGAKHDGNSLFGQLGLEFYGRYPAIWKDYVNFQESRTGRTRTREFSSAIAASIPYVGRTLARGIELEYPTLSLSAYPSIAAELFCEFLIELSRKHQVCMFLDNVQELDDWSAQLLSVTVGRSYRSIRYVAGFVTRAGAKGVDADGFAIQSKDIGYEVGVRQFPKPDEEFIRLYASANGVEWTRAHCRSIAAATKGDVYLIRAAVAAAGGSTSDLLTVIRELPPVGGSILALLTLARQDLRHSDILALCLDDSAVFVESEQEIDTTIDALSASELIGSLSLPDGDCLVSLRPSRETMKEALNLSLAEITRLQLRLYDYFSRVQKISGRHSASEVAPLLYRLAKKVAIEQTDTRLRDIIRLSLQMGTRKHAEDGVNKAISHEQNSGLGLQDYVAKLALLISIKRFGEILELTARPPRREWRQNRFVQIFRGIALNRRRFHTESEEILAGLCETYHSLEELAMMVSFRVVGRIHANDMNGARALYVRHEKELSKATNYGYFLRNGAEVFESAEGVEILTRALPIHERNGDTFGTATTLCNRGAKLAQIGQAEKGLIDVERAHELLEVFGIHHLGMVIGDLAHCYLYLGNYKEAESNCHKALRYMGRDLPKAYTLMNLAAAYLLQEQRDLANARVDSLLIEAENALVDRIRQKVYLNGALISLFAGAPAGKVESLCAKALKHPDRRNPKITVDLVGTIRKLASLGSAPELDSFLNLYSPCSMYYWYQNPLEGLPIDFLSLEAVAEDGRQHFSV
jgi:tetratricopeptide (TPR) repeat protein